MTTVYDAAGRKWKKTNTVDVLDEFNQPTGTTYTETRVYANGVEFSGEGTAASRIANINASADGRVAYSYDAASGAPSGSRVEYYHTDHLGNVRLGFSDLDGDGAITVGDIYDPTNEITQEQHYYPFGLTHTGAWFATVAPEDQYRYNGKELDEATGLYDYGARYYDPAIARWGQIDPLADQYAPYSPYNYVLGNPVRFVDPDGMHVETDYYNQKGRLVKQVDDGSDQKVLVLTNSKNADKVDAAIEAGKTGPVASSEALAKMNEAYEHSEAAGTEAGFAVATNGEVSSMAYGDENSVDVVSKRSELVESGMTVAYDVHTHPNGENDYGAPTPSEPDKSGIASGTDPQNSVVLGYTAREVVKPGQENVIGQKQTEIKVTRTIGFYNTAGSTGTMDFKRYQTVVNRINEN